MNHVPGFDEEFQGCYIIDLEDYRRRKKQGSREAFVAQSKARTPTTPHIVTLMKKALEFQRLLDAGEVKTGPSWRVARVSHGRG